MKNLLFLFLLVPGLVMAQSDVPFIEIVGEASEKISPDYITADVVISSSMYYDSYNEKEISKFENAMRKASAKLQLEPYLMYKNQFMGSCTSFEKEFKLKFDNVEDYVRIKEMAENADYDDLYIDFYLDDYKVSDERKESAANGLFVSALENAKAKAELAATTLGFEIGNVMMVEETESYNSYDDYYYDDYSYDYDYDTPNTIEITKSFYVRFEIK